MRKRVEFLGHVIEDGKIYPSSDKTVLVCFLTPRSLKNRNFLGLIGYFRKFISRYYNCKTFEWYVKKRRKICIWRCTSTFEQLKRSLPEDSVLKIYRPEDDTEVHTDGSQDGYGAVLYYNVPVRMGACILYIIPAVKRRLQNASTSYELEVLAAIEAVKKFRTYLLGIKYKLITDCAAFQKTLNKKDLTTRVAIWTLLLEEYDFTVEHRSDTRMKPGIYNRQRSYH